MEIEKLYYLGVVKKVVEEGDITKEYGIIEADIPGVIQGIRAFPKRSEISEPKEGDAILLLCLDPVLNSYWIYEKLKENDFIGIRASGKMIDITPDQISIGIFDRSQEYKEDERPEMKTYIKLDSDGNIEIETEKDINVKINGKSNIETKEDTTIKATKSCTIDSPRVDITGGTLSVNGGPGGVVGQGGFCVLPTCVLSGSPHICTQVMGT